MGGANLAAIGDGSSDNWEVFQFAEAELVAPNTYWLRKRLRGQAGTDGLMPAVWPQGSWFVLLNGVPSQIDLSPNLRRIVQNYRIGPAQRGFDDPSYQHLVRAFDGIGLRPYSPCHLQANRLQTGDIAVNWTRRTRLDGDGWDGSDVPLGEESESYNLRVLKDGAVMREVLIGSSTWTYDLAAQTIDNITGTFDISVEQVSATYGAGLPRVVRFEL